MQINIFLRIHGKNEVRLPFVIIDTDTHTHGQKLTESVEQNPRWKAENVLD